jgi:cell division GTPase FtsZ
LRNSDSIAIRRWRGVGGIISVIGVGQAGRGVLDRIRFDRADFLEEATQTADGSERLRGAIGESDVVIVIGGTEEKIYPIDLKAVQNDGMVALATRDASSSMGATLPEFVEFVASVVIGERNSIDFADIRSLMEDGELTAFGAGQGFGANKLDEAARKALSGGMMAGRTGIKKLLLDITAGPETGLLEMTRTVELVRALVNEDVMITFGHNLNSKTEEPDSARVVILAGECCVGSKKEWNYDPLCRIV